MGVDLLGVDLVGDDFVRVDFVRVDFVRVDFVGGHSSTITAWQGQAYLIKNRVFKPAL